MNEAKPFNQFITPPYRHHKEVELRNNIMSYSNKFRKPLKPEHVVSSLILATSAEVMNLRYGVEFHWSTPISASSDPVLRWNFYLLSFNKTSLTTRSEIIDLWMNEWASELICSFNSGFIRLNWIGAQLWLGGGCLFGTWANRNSRSEISSIWLGLFEI